MKKGMEMKILKEELRIKRFNEGVGNEINENDR
jgi:hypothetical protein